MFRELLFFYFFIFVVHFNAPLLPPPEPLIFNFSAFANWPIGWTFSCGCLNRYFVTHVLFFFLGGWGVGRDSTKIRQKNVFLVYDWMISSCQIHPEWVTVVGWYKSIRNFLRWLKNLESFFSFCLHRVRDLSRQFVGVVITSTI